MRHNRNQKKNVLGMPKKSISNSGSFIYIDNIADYLPTGHYYYPVPQDVSLFHEMGGQQDCPISLTEG